MKLKLLNVDTSCYKNIIYNKKDIAIRLFDEFDKQVFHKHLLKTILN